jgi:hypothetical protein
MEKVKGYIYANMRMLSIGVIALFIIVIIESCKDKFLESVPQSGILTDVSVFKTKADFEAYMFGAYTEMQSGNASADKWISVPGFVSQDMVAVDEKPKPLASFLTPGSGDILSYWRNLYTVISRTNLILEKLPVAPAVVTAEDKSILEGEAKFLRGFAYFMLARAWGNIPMPLQSFNDAQKSLECTSEDQVWDQVIKDLTEASLLLPSRSGWGSNNLGRATKGAALAYLANAWMYKKDWTKAAKASQDLIARGEYRLEEDVRTVFSEKNENNEESIFEVQFRKVEDNDYNWGSTPNNGHSLNILTAPRGIGEKYAPYGGWGEFLASKKLANSFEPGDERREKLMVTVGETYKGEKMTESVTLPDTIQANSAFSTKYWLGPEGSYLGGLNLPQMRYAEFLLNYSEILFEQENALQAYKYLNEVRKRANLPDKPVSTDRETYFTDLMNERRHELNFEPNLWFHYTRTGRAGKFLQEEYGITFNPSWNKFPIPQVDRDQNPKLCQNGY